MRSSSRATWVRDETELREHAGEMVLDRLRAEEHHFRDLAIRSSLSDQLGDLPLAAAERVDSLRGSAGPASSRDSPAEAAQLAGRLVAVALRPQLIELPARTLELVDGPIALALGGERAARHDPRGRRLDREPGILRRLHRLHPPPRRLEVLRLDRRAGENLVPVRLEATLDELELGPVRRVQNQLRAPPRVLSSLEPCLGQVAARERGHGVGLHLASHREGEEGQAHLRGPGARRGGERRSEPRLAELQGQEEEAEEVDAANRASTGAWSERRSARPSHGISRASGGHWRGASRISSPRTSTWSIAVGAVGVRSPKRSASSSNSGERSGRRLKSPPKISGASVAHPLAVSAASRTSSSASG